MASNYKRNAKPIEDFAEVEYVEGRASVDELMMGPNHHEPPPLSESDAVLTDPYTAADKDLILGIYCQTNWIANHWSRETDQRLHEMGSDIFDLADRMHYLSVTVITTFLVMIIAVAILLGVVML
jgi:hypothetical protein